MFEKRVTRRICEPKRDEIIGGWRKMQNEGLRNSPKIKVVQSKRMRWALACVWYENPKERDN
jgi:hypothetical protein